MGGGRCLRRTRRHDRQGDGGGFAKLGVFEPALDDGLRRFPCPPRPCKGLTLLRVAVAEELILYAGVGPKVVVPKLRKIRVTLLVAGGNTETESSAEGVGHVEGLYGERIAPAFR